MAEPSRIDTIIRKRLLESDLSFRDFVEIALYEPGAGYYARGENRVGKGGDYITSPTLSPVFAFAIAALIREFVSRAGDGPSTFVDIGCGDGSLILSAFQQSDAETRARVRFLGVDRSLERLTASAREEEALTFVHAMDEVPRDGAHLIFSNELFDAFPFARLVMRGGTLRELCVTERDGHLDWSERQAPAEYAEYFTERRIALEEGQFADITPEWSREYARLAGFLTRGLILTFDYGYPERKLFHPRARRFGTAVAYAGHTVTRDLLANPGGQDLTAHINFDDLMRAGEERGLQTLFFDRQARFLLSIGITQHPLFASADEIAPESLQHAIELIRSREEARRLILPDGIGEDIRVLVQAVGQTQQPWSFATSLC